MKQFNAYTHTLTRYLQILGYKVIETKALEDSDKQYWIFEDTPSIREAVDFYISHRDNLEL